MTTTDQTTPSELAQSFLLSILIRDTKTLQKLFKLSPGEVAAITPTEQTAAAVRLLASSNTALRSMSKRVMQAEAGLVKNPPAAPTNKAPTFNPAPFSSPRVAK